VIEVDGAQHLEQMPHDRLRSAWLRGRGYEVIRFMDREVLTEIESAEAEIWSALTNASR
jgi:very-short-patch-repair endonuclease